METLAWLLLLLSVLLTAVFFFFAKPLLHLLGAVFQMLATGFVPFIRNMGGATFAMVAMILGFVTNIILDYAFVWVLPWGMAGAAWATIIGQAVTMLAAILFFVRKKRRIGAVPLSELPPLWGAVLKVSLSPFGLTYSSILLFLSSLKKVRKVPKGSPQNFHTARSITDYKRCHFHSYSSISILLWTFSHKRLTFAFTSESGYTLALASKIAHSGSQGQTGGIFAHGRLLAGCEKNQSENEETRACGDALRRAIVGPSRRSPAGLRCPVCNLAMLLFFALRAGLSAQAKLGGDITTLGKLHVVETLGACLSKRLTCRFPLSSERCSLCMGLFSCEYTDISVGKFSCKRFRVMVR